MNDKSWIRDLITFVLSVAFIVVPVRIFVAQPFLVSGASMEENFHNADYLIIDRLSYRLGDPQRGDVVVFKYPKDPSKFFIKRIIGLPTEKVIIDGTRVFIENSENKLIELEENYVTYQNRTNMMMQLGEDEYFVLGDNRPQSVDSRTFTGLTKDLIVGKVFLRLFPISDISILPGKANYLDN
jgi:signal peptidase I